RIQKLLIIPGSVVLILFGVGLIFSDATGYKDDFPTWLMAAITIFVIVIVVDAAVQQRQVRQAMATLEGVSDGAELPAAYRALGKRIQMLGGIEGLAVVVIIFLMTYKPGQ
ncbi:MAG: DUF2269 family protein, partial [Tepidiformaceae bacterium]